MDKLHNALRWIIDVVGKIIATPLVIPGFAMLYIGNLILELTHKE